MLNLLILLLVVLLVFLTWTIFRYNPNRLMYTIISAGIGMVGIPLVLKSFTSVVEASGEAMTSSAVAY